VGELKRYEVEERPGVFTTLKLTDEEAERIGARPIGEKAAEPRTKARTTRSEKAAEPRNKARTTRNKTK
jgi:hypothetical protein